MKISFEEARQIAEELVKSRSRNKMVIVDEATIEKDYGWYFFSQSKKFLETKSISDIMLGDIFILVKKDNGEVVEFGSAYSPEKYIRTYERENYVK